jgi:hypothetical protein
MKKLIATTALVSLAALSAANAETKITGNLGLSLLAHSYDPATGSDRTNSFNSVGRESQINVSNSGTLSNGLKYAAGFSWEAEGNESLNGKSTGENTYIDLIAGDTTFSFSSDHIDNLNANPTNLVGFGYLQAAGGLYTKADGHVGDQYSLSVGQKFGGTKITLAYIPHTNSVTAATDVFDGVTNTTSGTNGASATSLILKGDLGVPGLAVLIGKDHTSDEGITKGVEKTKYSASYTVGKIKVAAEKDDYNAATTAASVDAQSIGLAYAVSDSVSVGVTYGEAEFGTMTAGTHKKEETTMVAVGYNLGAVSVQAQYKNVSNLNAAVNVDAQEVGIYLGTKF